MDKFFDCCNVRNTIEWKRKQKKFLKPYFSIDDERFEYLKSFITTLYQWKKETLTRNDKNYSNDDRKKMFISRETYEGIVITSKSLIECVRFMLQSGASYVLTERFCQDDLENYFGKQRSIGRRKDNPRLVDVGYNDNTIKTQFTVKPIVGGNVRPCEQTLSLNSEPLKKRKKNSSF